MLVMNNQKRTVHIGSILLLPGSNIVAIDYDPGASEVNQLNRIKLMLEAAKRKLREQEQK